MQQKLAQAFLKSNCSVISFATEDIIRIADAVQERTINELGVLTAENSDSFKRMVIGYLNLMRTNGAFEDKVFDEYTMGDGNGYMLSNDRNRWLPGRQSGRNTPRFIAEHIGNGRSSFEFDSPAANKYVDWIASCCNEVLVDDSTFRAISTANLAADIRENLRKICTLEELRRIEVIHLDAWVNQFLRESGFSAQIGYDDVINPLWERAVLLANIDLPYETTFYEEEWNRIVIAQEALTLEKYVKATRNGRGTRLDRKKRMQVWKVFENYQNLMKENQIRDINTAMYESTKLLQSAGRKPRYASIIIDEGQDFSDNAYRLIRALAGEEHPNDIFIVGDSHQRIYRNYPTLSKCGINVRGRSSILKINYRTTEEIRKHAFALLNGISFDDLDEDLDLGDKCQSLTHGEKPIVENFENANDEFDFLLREVKKLKENGVSLTDICVVARTKKLVDDYIALFTRAGIRSYAIKRNKVDDRSFDGLRVATMHRVKEEYLNVL